MSEIWKDIEGYEGIYQVSNIGRIKSFDRMVSNKGKPYIIKGKIMAQYVRRSKNLKQGDGYFAVGLRKEKKQKGYFVHRIIALAFIPNPLNKPTVNHKDGNKLNNNINNLEWATHQENTKHAWKNGLCYSNSVHGEEHYRSKLTENDVLFIRECSETNEMSTLELSIKYDVSRSHINRIKRNAQWKHLNTST